MNKIILMFIIFSFFSCKQKENTAVQNQSNNNYKTIGSEEINIDDFIGDWEMVSTMPNDGTFMLHLSKNSEDKLLGFYCAVAKNGNKIDCSTDNENNIKTIKIENDGILLQFESFFGAKNGEAKISLSNKKLHWIILKRPIGEFYCPEDVYLVQKAVKLNQFNKSEKININSKNYKGSDITMQLYKEIIENYGCGENSVNGKILGKQNNFELFIIENDCGDFPFKDLLSVKDGKIIDKLNIESSSFDIEKSERDNIQDKTEITFNINNTTNINILSIHSINDKILNKTSTSYELNTQGIFVEK